jgi:hypothetical protein
MSEYQYNLDPQGRVRFPGIYSGKVKSINDPLKKSRIQVIVQQPTGPEITAWAEACLPVHQNAIHPDHKPHLATFTTTSAGDVAHTHQVTVSFPNHAHVESTDPQETDTVNEHTAHRIIPRIGQLVWVMFIAGDPDHPVWIGVQHD